MKIRVGFVSNSSSSSFLIVGVGKYDDVRLAELAKADGCDHDSWGNYNEGKTLIFLGGEYEDEDDSNDMYKPYYVGISVEQDLKDGKTVPELKKEFIKRAKALNVVFNEKEVDLHYGEVSSE